MGLLSKLNLFSKSAPASASAGLDASELAREARSRARRRLIGASVLLGIGIVGFPLLFESRPRPIPVDIPIEIPAREGVAPLQQPLAKVDARRPETMPSNPIDEPLTEAAAPASATRPGMGVKAAAVAALATVGVVAAQRPDAEASQAKPADKPAAKPAATPASKPAPAKVEPKPVVKVEPKPVAKVEPKPVAKVEPKPDPKPAPVKPEPKPAPAKPEPKPEAKAAAKPAADDGRYVVQIGAFAEVGTAREARMKVEGMGLKTYTQVIESATGRRIRVRVGPYATKAEADKAAARIKTGGLQAAVLVL